MLEWYMRPALAFGCVVFALIGCPVGMWANRGDYLSIFVVCFLPTLFSYYPLLLSGAGLARDGKVSLLSGVWAANAIGLFAALILTWRLVKR
jgi:lipopolysaccharide export system permease protein